MSCNACKQVCNVYSCYSNLYLGKIALLSTEVTVVIKNVGTERTVFQTVTSSGAGVLTLTGGTWSKMLYTSAQIEIQVIKDGEIVQIYPYTDPSTPTFSTTLQDCLVFNTLPLYDSDGDMYALPNQYLIEP